jgi:hypothetical protein
MTSMKPAQLITGVILVVLGVLAFAGVGFTTNKARVAVGPLEATVKEERTLPPVVAGGAIVLGVVLLAAAGRRSR